MKYHIFLIRFPFVLMKCFFKIHINKRMEWIIKRIFHINKRMIHFNKMIFCFSKTMLNFSKRINDISKSRLQTAQLIVEKEKKIKTGNR